MTPAGKAKGAATKTLCCSQIARVADKPELLARDLARDQTMQFDEAARRQRAQHHESKKHAAAVNQKRNGQRSSYQAPKGVNLALLAKGNDLSKYIKARQNSRISKESKK